MRPDTTVVAGIDVGGERKGFHAVALRGREVIDKLASPDPHAIADWCRSVGREGAQAVGVDAPCRWSRSGGSRQAERELMRAGIHCFFSPTRAAAERHPRNYYGWMLRGAVLYAELEKTHRLYAGEGATSPPRQPACFETFPQAIACALAGRIVAARDKRAVRKRLLEEAGIDTAPFTNIDWIDAALCALAAQAFVAGRVRVYGEAGEGVIVLPVGGRRS